MTVFLYFNTSSPIVSPPVYLDKYVKPIFDEHNKIQTNNLKFNTTAIENGDILNAYT